MWERIANSGHYVKEAETMQDALAEVPYNPEYVKFTVVEMAEGSSIRTMGTAN